MIEFEYYLRLMNNKLDYIAIDFETANQFKNSACSVGLVRFINGKETDSCYSLIHPAKMYFIPEWTRDIHHISYEYVRDKPYFPEIWDTMVIHSLTELQESLWLHIMGTLLTCRLFENAAIILVWNFLPLLILILFLLQEKHGLKLKVINLQNWEIILRLNIWLTML